MRRDIFTEGAQGVPGLVRTFIAKEIAPYHEQSERGQVCVKHRLPVPALISRNGARLPSVAPLLTRMSTRPRSRVIRSTRPL
jgi:hypothetical protein